MSGIRLSQLHTWATHEANAREVLLEALTSLKEEENLPIKENDVSRKLLFCIRRANRLLSDKGRGVPHPITYQAQNAPDASDLQATRSERKIPDFQWGITDQTVENPTKADRHLIIECKRLGKLPSGGILNAKYVEDGVLRFITEEHRYGKYTDSGIMIGYVQNMELLDVWNEVDAAIKNHSLPLLIISNQGWQKRGVSHLVLQRRFAKTG